MITEAEIQRAFDFLRDSAPDIADAKADRKRLDELRKVVWSELRRQSDEKTQGEKDADAYSNPKYREHIEKMHKAERLFELLRAQREAAVARIDAWRTFSANERGAARAA